MKKKTIAAGLIAGVVGLTLAGIVMADQTTAFSRKARGGRLIRRAIARAIEELNLSEEQQGQIASVVREHSDGLLEATKPLLVSKGYLFNAVHADQFDEQAVREAYRQSAQYGEEMAVLRARMAAEIKGVLTDEQKEILARKKVEMFGKVVKVLDMVHAAAEAWLLEKAPVVEE